MALACSFIKKSRYRTFCIVALVAATACHNISTDSQIQYCTSRGLSISLHHGYLYNVVCLRMAYAFISIVVLHKRKCDRSPKYTHVSACMAIRYANSNVYGCYTSFSQGTYGVNYSAGCIHAHFAIIILCKNFPSEQLLGKSSIACCKSNQCLMELAYVEFISILLIGPLAWFLSILAFLFKCTLTSYIHVCVHVDYYYLLLLLLILFTTSDIRHNKQEKFKTGVGWWTYTKCWWSQK